MSRRPPHPPKTRCLPCLKGGGPTEGWWRDSVRGNGRFISCKSVRGRIPQSRQSRDWGILLRTAHPAGPLVTSPPKNHAARAPEVPPPAAQAAYKNSLISPAASWQRLPFSAGAFSPSAPGSPPACGGNSHPGPAPGAPAPAAPPASCRNISPPSGAG